MGSDIIVTAGRGYGKEAFMKLLLDFGVRSVFIVDENLLKVDSVVCSSHLNPARADEDQKGEEE